MLEYLGYLASLIVLISLLMSSAKKLRLINLAGSLIFAVYGFLIHAYPVAVMNAAVAIINIYYLYKMYRSQDYFRILPIDKNSEYLKYLLSFYENDIARFFSTTSVDVDHSTLSFYILRNVVPAGFFVANQESEGVLRIDFDYVVPTYRDFKMGEYIYNSKRQMFLDKGFNVLLTYTRSEKHEAYLKRMGFRRKEALDKDNRRAYTIDLNA